MGELHYILHCQRLTLEYPDVGDIDTNPGKTHKSIA